ncbi:MAG: BrnT family toxin [Planctomycetes bacterium]|nr:BrnT family toxin [Planctomycetota bacterium]
MSELRFEWDPRKAAANKSKHGVTFDEAVSVFADELALFMADPEHSDKEDRFVLLGLSSSVRLLVVVHSHREDDETIRIISARRANNRERAHYKESNSP